MYSSCLDLNGEDARLVFQKVSKMEDGRSLGRSLLTNDEPRRFVGKVATGLILAGNTSRGGRQL